MKCGRLNQKQISELEKRFHLGESLTKIYKTLGISKGTVWYHFRKLKSGLSSQERKARGKLAFKQFLGNRKVKAEERRKERSTGYSALWQRFHHKLPSLSRSAKGKIAETAILLRLLLLGLEVYEDTCPDKPFDWAIFNGKRLLKIQVKWIQVAPGGSLKIKTIRSARCSTYRKSDCDFIVGYCLEQDACYIIPVNKVVGKCSIPPSLESKENWKCLL